MRYIVIGLGFFGSYLATKLTSLGHEVIGIDRHVERAEELKDSITKVMIMDCTKYEALQSLTPVANNGHEHTLSCYLPHLIKLSHIVSWG